MCKLFVFIASFTSVALYGVTLQFVPNTPLTQVTDISVDIHQLLPGLELNTQAKQRLETQISIDSEEDLSLTEFPLDIIVTPKKLKIDLNVNDETITFDSERPVSSVYFAQVSKLIDRSITLQVGEDRLVLAKSGELEQLKKELPLFKEFNVEIFLREMFQHAFALGEEKLKQDKTYAIKYDPETLPYVPSKVNYTITSISNETVIASIKGKLKERRISLNGQLQVDNKAFENVDVIISGNMVGNIKWDRNNALKHQLNLDYTYQGVIKIGHWEWKIEADLTIENQTKV